MTIHDHGDWAPRLAFAWGSGTEGRILAQDGVASRLRAFLRPLCFVFGAASGALERGDATADIGGKSRLLSRPADCPWSGTQCANSQVSPTIYQISPTLRAPRTWQSAVSIERQLGKKGTVAVTYLNSRGEHQLFLRNINAPLPGTFDPADPTSGVRPLGNETTSTNMTRRESSGRTSSL